MAALLLDTCAAVWAAEDALSPEAVEAIDRAYRADAPLYLSPITAWEVGVLMARGRVASPLSAQGWFDRLLTTPGVKLAELTPSIMIASSHLPAEPPRDPADRFMVATARELGVALVTRDRALLAYARAGHLQAVAC